MSLRPAADGINISFSGGSCILLAYTSDGRWNRGTSGAWRQGLYWWSFVAYAIEGKKREFPRKQSIPSLLQFFHFRSKKEAFSVASVNKTVYLLEKEKNRNSDPYQNHDLLRCWQRFRLFDKHHVTWSYSGKKRKFLHLMRLQVWLFENAVYSSTFVVLPILKVGRGKNNRRIMK